MEFKRSTGAPDAGKSMPLARQFTIRYVLALAVFAVVSVWTLYSMNTTLDGIDQEAEQGLALAQQADRIQRIDVMASQLVAVLEDGTDTGTMQTSFVDAVGDLREVHLGLTLGTGDSGLDVPQDKIAEFWATEGADLDSQILAFHEQASLVPGLLARGNEEDARQTLTSAVQSLHAAADLTATDSLASNLSKAQEIYAESLADHIESQRSISRALQTTYAAMLALGVLVAFRPMARRIHDETSALQMAERKARENNERQLFRTQFANGLEGAGEEHEIFEKVALALEKVVPDKPGELLLADPQGRHLRQIAVHPSQGAPGCPVEDSRDCAAITHSTTVTYETSRALNACSKLAAHENAPCSAVCAPITFTGQALGVLHLTGDDLHQLPNAQLERINVIASETGNWLGTLRARKSTERQAATDGLTGLPNRRSLATSADRLSDAGTRYAIAIADLDHFKDLNDTYGHETGDRALRLFSSVLRAGVRPIDTAARYGGEEFVVLFADTSIEEASEVLERLQKDLSKAIQATGSVPFTASWGLTDSTVEPTFEECLKVADIGLYEAKSAGRDRIVLRTVGGQVEPSPGERRRDRSESDPPADTNAPGADPLDAPVAASEEEEAMTPPSDADGIAAVAVSLRCDACEVDNPVETRFCLNCGAALASHSG